MTLWLLGGALTLIVALFLARPFLAAGAKADGRRDYDLEVYKDQLAELERDAARGVVGPAEAEAARVEIQRRILAAAAGAEAAPAPRAAVRPLPALAIALGLPFAAGAVYLAIGQPGLPAQPFAARVERPPDAATARRIAELEARVARAPNDLAARVALAEALFEAQMFRRAAEAYRQAAALSGGRFDLVGLYAESIVRANGGLVTDHARQVLEQVARGDPADVRAQFYLGLAEAQAGKTRAALERWARLEAAAPADAPYLEPLRREMKRVADEAGISLDELRREIAGARPRGPSERDVKDAEKMSPEERMAMIRGMIANLEERLKSTPNDIEGWKRLGRAYSVLREHDKAAAAYARAHELAPQDTALLADYASELVRARPEGKPLPDGTVAVLRKLLAADPQNALALLYLGLDAADAGRKEEALDLLRRLLARLPQDAPPQLRRLVEERIKALQG